MRERQHHDLVRTELRDNLSKKPCIMGILKKRGGGSGAPDRGDAVRSYCRRLPAVDDVRGAETTASYRKWRVAVLCACDTVTRARVVA